MSEGSIMDTTIIHAPSSTKNKAGNRDPEMASTKKGNTWHYGMKAHADQGHKEQAESDDIEWRRLRKARRGRRLNCCNQAFNRKSNRTRAQIEHPFGVVKHLWGIAMSGTGVWPRTPRSSSTCSPWQTSIWSAGN